MACHVAPEGATIFLDNYAAVCKVNSSTPALLSFSEIDQIRLYMAEKQLVVKWIKGHSDSIPNQMADFAAKEALQFQKPHLPLVTTQGTFQFAGEKLNHIKPIIKHTVKTHHHSEIHSMTWTVRKKKFFKGAEHNWFFGIKIQPGFDRPTVSWKFDPKKHKLCISCGVSHDCSVYGTLGKCKKWGNVRAELFESWGPLQEHVSAWLSTTQDWTIQQIFWRLLLPIKLVGKLEKMGYKLMYIKKWYHKFVQSGCKMIGKLKEQPTPMKVVEFTPGKERMNPFIWPEDSPGPMAQAQ